SGVCRSSASTKSQPRSPASRLPIVDFPEPETPITTTTTGLGRERGCVMERVSSATPAVARPSGARGTETWRRRARALQRPAERPAGGPGLRRIGRARVDLARGFPKPAGTEDTMSTKSIVLRICASAALLGAPLLALEA